MATSSPFSSFFSLLLPPKPHRFTLPPSFSRFPSQNQTLTSRHDDRLSLSASSSDLSSVMYPSLAHSNTLFFRSAYNVQVVVDDNEPEERLLNRFRREVMKAGVIQECKRRRFFENKQDEKKRKTREAAKRNRRPRRPQLRTPYQNKQDVPSTKKEDDDDNWDLPEGDTPYV